MISFSNNRWIIVSIGHFVTLFFVGQLNYYLSPLGIQLFILGALLSFSSLELNFNQGILSIIPIGLYLDSKSPLPFGYILFACLTLFTIAHVLRSRVRREAAASSLASSILLNLAAFSVYTGGALYYFGSEGINFGPLALNLFAGTLVVAIMNRLFFDTHTGLLSIFGINLAEEQREAR